MIDSLLDEHIQKDYGQTVLVDNFSKLAKNIASINGVTQEEAALRILHDVCIRRELMDFDNSTSYNPNISNLST